MNFMWPTNIAHQETKFKNIEKDPLSRFKAFKKYYHHLYCKSQEKLQAFIFDNREEIFILVLALLQKLEDSDKKKVNPDQIKRALDHAVEVVERMYKEDIESLSNKLEGLIKDCLNRRLLPEINDIGFNLIVEALKKFQSYSEVAKAVPGLLEIFEKGLERSSYLNPPSISQSEESKYEVMEVMRWQKAVLRDNYSSYDESKRVSTDSIKAFFKLLMAGDKAGDKASMLFQVFNRHWLCQIFPKLFVDYFQDSLPFYDSSTLASSPFLAAMHSSRSSLWQFDALECLLARLRDMVIGPITSSTVSGATPYQRIVEKSKDLDLIFKMESHPLDAYFEAKCADERKMLVKIIRECTMKTFQRWLVYDSTSLPKNSPDRNQKFIIEIIRKLFSLYRHPQPSQSQSVSPSSSGSRHFRSEMLEILLHGRGLVEKCLLKRNSPSLWAEVFTQVWNCLKPLDAHYEAKTRNAATEFSDTNEAEFNREVMAPLFKFMLQLVFKAAQSSCSFQPDWAKMQHALLPWLERRSFYGQWSHALKEETRTLFYAICQSGVLQYFDARFVAPFAPRGSMRDAQQRTHAQLNKAATIPTPNQFPFDMMANKLISSHQQPQPPPRHSQHPLTYEQLIQVLFDLYRVYNSKDPESLPDYIQASPNFVAYRREAIYVSSHPAFIQFSTWYSVLHLMQKPHERVLRQLSVPAPLKEAETLRTIKTVQDVIDRFMQPFPDPESPEGSMRQPSGLKISLIQNWSFPANTLLDMFGDWLFTLCEMKEHSDSKFAAFQTLCKILSECQSEIAIAPRYLPRIIKVLFLGLRDPSSPLAHHILLNSNGVFALDLPGFHTLLPQYLDTVRVIISARAKPNYGSDVLPSHQHSPNRSHDLLLACSKLFSSLLCFPHFFQNLEIKTLTPMRAPSRFKFADLKPLLIDQLLALLQVQSNLPHHTPKQALLAGEALDAVGAEDPLHIGLYCLTVLVFQELSEPDKRVDKAKKVELLSKVIAAIRDVFQRGSAEGNQRNMRAAFACLSSLAGLFHVIFFLQRYILSNVLSNFTTWVLLLGEHKKLHLLPQLLDVALEWILEDRTGYLLRQNSKILPSLFQALSSLASASQNLREARNELRQEIERFQSIVLHYYQNFPLLNNRPELNDSLLREQIFKSLSESQLTRIAQKDAKNNRTLFSSHLIVEERKSVFGNDTGPFLDQLQHLSAGSSSQSKDIPFDRLTSQALTRVLSSDEDSGDSVDDESDELPQDQFHQIPPRSLERKCSSNVMEADEHQTPAVSHITSAVTNDHVESEDATTMQIKVPEESIRPRISERTILAQIFTLMPKRKRNDLHTSSSLSLQNPAQMAKIATMPSASTLSEDSDLQLIASPTSYQRNSQQAYSTSITSDTLAYQRKAATSLLPPKSGLDSRVFPNKDSFNSNNSFFIGLPNMGVGSTPNLPPSSGSKHSRHLREYQVQYSALEKNLRDQGELSLTKRRPGALPSSPLKPLLSDNLYLIYRKNKIYTSVPAPLNRAKILLRNTVGKFAWTVKHYRAFSLKEGPGIGNKSQLKIQKSDVGQMKKNMLTLYDPSIIAQKLLSYSRKYSEPENSDPQSSNLFLLIDLETADRNSSLRRKPADEQKINLNSMRQMHSPGQRMTHQPFKEEPLEFVMEEEKVPISLDSQELENSFRSQTKLSGSAQASPRAEQPATPKPDFLKKMIIETLGMHPELDKFKSLAGQFKEHQFNQNQEPAQKEIAESQHYYNIEQLLFPRCANQSKLSLREQFEKFLHEVSFTFQLEGSSQGERRFKMKGDSTDQMCIANKETAQSFDGFRAFVTRLGIVDVSAFTSELNMVEEVNEFQASLNILDRDAFFRKQLRVGLVYVKAGQCEESEVFANNEGSLPFEEFIRSVGRVKDLSTHRGYSGGLMSPTNASASYELAFHVNTLMPTVSGDKQQIAKKKFIGNDSIHVVWSEAQRPYRQTTIKSSFNFVHLVVYPLPSGLFKVTVLRKRDKVDFFGPLLDGMVVSKEILPSLVRATIINAERSIRDMRLRSLKSYHSRKKLIKQSIYDRVQAKLKESIGPEGYNINNLISTQNKLSSELFR